LITFAYCEYRRDIPEHFMLRFSKIAFAPFSATIGTSGNRNSSVPARHATGLRRHGLLTSDDPATAGRGGS
jgi:hypothetical protein